MIKPSTPEAYSLFHDGLLTLAEMERNGLRIDTDYLDRKIEETKLQIRELEENLKKDKVYRKWVRKFRDKTNLGSRDQLSQLVFTELGYAPKGLTSTGRIRADKDALDGIDLPFVRDYLTVEKLKKMLSTNLIGIKREVCDGFLHPFFNANTVSTFRLSSSLPNSQNIPIRDKLVGPTVRGMFIPREGCATVEIDYGSLEFKGAACVVGNTAIETIDGPQSIKKIIERLERKEQVFVYGHSRKKGRVKVSEVIEGGVTRKNAEVWKVTLDNGKSVIATPDHKFLLRTGEYRQLQDLTVGDSLMPFYKTKKKSPWGTVYTNIYLNNGLKELAHNLIALDVHGENIRGSRNVVHHKDGNGTNNSLKNLEVMTRSDHMKIHVKQSWKKYSKSRQEWNNSKENKLILKKARENYLNSLSDKDREEWSARVSESVRRRGGHSGKKNPMFGKKHSDEAKKKMSEKKDGFVPESAGWNKGLTKKTSKSVLRISLANTGKEAWNKGLKLPPLSEDTKKKISLAGVGRLVSEDTKKKISKHRLAYWRNKKREQCKVCGREFLFVHYNHLKSAHGLTVSEYKKTYNHKVVSIEKLEEKQDVYNITVKGIHNFAVEAGVVIKNCFWKDPNMVDYADNHDVHRTCAAKLFLCEPGQVTKDARYLAKNRFVFPILYGSYYRKCAMNLWRGVQDMGITLVDGMPMFDHLKKQGVKKLGLCDTKERPVKGTFEHKTQEAENWFNGMFPKFMNGKDPWWNEYCRNGYFQMQTGFVCSGVFSRNFLLNAPIQGSGSHLLLWSANQLRKHIRKYKRKWYPSGCIHDCLLTDMPPKDVPEYLEVAEDIMTRKVRKHWDWILTRLEVEADVVMPGENWSQKKPWTKKDGVWKPKENKK